MISRPSFLTALMTRSSVCGRSTTLTRRASLRTTCRDVAVTMIRSPTRQSATGSSTVIVVAPLSAGLPSFTHVRPSGLPCKSQRHRNKRSPGIPRGQAPAPRSIESTHCGPPESALPACQPRARARATRIRRHDMILTIEARLASVVACLDLDQPDVQPSIAPRVEPQRPGDMNRSDRAIGLDIKRDDMSTADLNPRPAAGDPPVLPRRRFRPSPTGG